MAIYSTEVCKEGLALWRQAEKRVATGQRYQIGDRSLTKADLKQIREQIKFWSRELEEAEEEEKCSGRDWVLRFLPPITGRLDNPFF